MNSLRRITRILATAPFLVSMGCSPDPSYRGRSADDWTQLLTSGNREERLNAAVAFTMAPPHKPAHVRPLLSALADPDSGVRAAALAAVRRLPDSASKALAIALHDYVVGVRRGAALALGHMNKDTARPVAALVDATHDPDDSVRTLAVLSLGELSNGAREALGRIQQLALSPGPQRAAALMVMPNIDTESRSLIQYYLPALTDTSVKVRTAAAWAILSAAGDRAHEAVGPLVNALRDPDDSVQMTALRSLGFVADHDSVAIRGIQTMRRSSEPNVRRVADSLAQSIHPR